MSAAGGSIINKQHAKVVYLLLPGVLSKDFDIALSCVGEKRKLEDERCRGFYTRASPCGLAGACTYRDVSNLDFVGWETSKWSSKFAVIVRRFFDLL